MAEEQDWGISSKEAREGPPLASVPTAPARGFGIGVDDQALAFRPKNWEEIWNFASMVAKTEFVPAGLRGNPGAVLAAVQFGHEVGLPAMASLRWICVIKGVPTIWGDGFWGCITNHPYCEWFVELSSMEALAKGYGECTIKRKGNPHPITRRFTLEMAETAGLVSNKDGAAWNTHRGRMLQMRARSLAGRDAIPEATGGLSIREEVLDNDYPESEPPIQTPKALPAAESGTGDRTDDKASGASAAGPALKAVPKKGPGRPRNPVKAEPTTEQQQQPAERAAENAPPTDNGASTAPVTQEDLVNEGLLWIEMATAEEIFAPNESNWLMTHMRKVKGTENQLKLYKPFNDRKAKLRQIK